MRRSVTVQVLPDASVIVKAPIFFPQSKIEEFLKKHASWILKKKEIALLQKKALHSNQYLYLGQNLQLTFGNYQNIKVTESKILFPEFLKFRLEKELTRWYIKSAQTFITELVTTYAKKMKTSYKSISFSDTKSKWGSCSPENDLQFNWRLIMSPPLTIAYVVVHELAHTIEKNHGRGFWNIVKFYSPSYKTQRNWLKTHGHTLKLIV